MNRFEEALKWLDEVKRDYAAIALLKGITFDGQKYQTPEHFETIEYALKFCAMLDFDVMLAQLKKEVEDA